MKTLYKLILFLFLVSNENTFAQSDIGIPYQAIARDAAGNLLSNQTISLRFSILENSITGPVIYSETHTVTTNEFGLFTVTVGKGVIATTTGPFDPSKWNIISTFMKTEMDVNGATNFVDMGTSQLMSVPFAAVALKAPGAVNYAGTWDANAGSPPATTTSHIKGNYYVVSIGGNTNLNGITNWEVGDWAIHNGTVWEKVDNSDAVQPAEVNAKVSKSGDTMTGYLILNADPTSALGGATKQYVDVGDAALQGQFYDLIDSYIHQEDDGVSIYLPPGGTRKRFGIGDTQPDAPLGILAESNGERAISIKSSDTYISGNNQNWFFGLRSLNSNSTGLNIEDASSGTGLSRFFIQGSTGNIGLGTVSPSEKLELNDSVPEGFAGIKILNTATSSLHGWKLGQLHDPLDARKDRALIFSEPVSFSPSPGITRLTILSGGNVGINEVAPDVKLHVTRPVSDPQSTLSLIEGTGILMLGQIDDNHLLMDNHQIQARKFDPLISTTTLIPTALNLQPHGGPIFIYAEEGIEEQIVFTDGGKIGIGTDTPAEKLHIKGRFFVEGDTPTSTIENAAGSIFNSSHQGAGSVRRTGLRLWCSGDWSGSPLSKNIGLYISDVSGASSNESNLAAVLNGNTVIGDITDAPAIGTFGKNVLAIQNGIPPTSPAGFASTPAGGVQLYSASDLTGASIFHLMNGNGNIIKLYRSAALTPPNNSPIPAAAYTPAVAQVIENLRQRINELEEKLQANGLLD